jgi:hypothetical protein
MSLTNEQISAIATTFREEAIAGDRDYVGFMQAFNKACARHGVEPTRDLWARVKRVIGAHKWALLGAAAGAAVGYALGFTPAGIAGGGIAGCAAGHYLGDRRGTAPAPAQPQPQPQSATAAAN